MGCGMGFLQIVVFGSYTLAFWYVIQIQEQRLTWSRSVVSHVCFKIVLMMS